MIVGIYALLITAFTALFGAVLAAPTAEPAAELEARELIDTVDFEVPDNTTTVNIFSRAFNKKICLARDPAYCLAGNTQNVFLASYADAGLTQWQAYASGSSTFNTVWMNSGSGYAMKVDTLANGAQVKLGVPSNSNRHSWQWIGQQLNLWNTNTCLDLNAGVIYYGAPMQIWVCYNNANQKWVLR